MILTVGKAQENAWTTLLLSALAKTGLDYVLVEHRPRLLSDNGSCYVSKELQHFLERRHFEQHT